MTYTPGDLERFVPEPEKSSYFAGGANPSRSEFARDRARILHSSSLRRLAGKTQVVVPGEDDFPRTRLTHSLEVAQIAREMGQALGMDPDVTDAAGLAHDLGHPPFGHNGELALNLVSADFGGFEGNAQTLRVLTRLESKVLAGDVNAGLNLTRAVLDACCKYPWERRDGQAKFGVYADDLAAFTWMRAGRGDDVTCVEAQVMDWADDVAYSVHDVEDGIMSGLIDLRSTRDPQSAAEICAIAAQDFIKADTQMLQEVWESLLGLPVLQDVAAHGAGVGTSRRGRVALKRATSELLGRFSQAAVGATRESFGADSIARYGAQVVVPDPIRAECALLKATAVRYVMQRDGAAQLQARQRDLLTELVAVLGDRPELLMDQHADAFAQANDDAARMRAIIDQVAELTDSTAMAWHERLCEVA